MGSCIDTYRARYRAAFLRTTDVVPGIPSVLARLAERYRLAVATSKIVEFSVPLLAALQLDQFFDAVAGPELGVATTDKSAVVGSALAMLVTDRAVMVGDRCFDIAAARAHSLPAIGVTWGIGSRGELNSAGADVLTDDPSELHVAVRDLMPQAAPRPQYRG